MAEYTYMASGNTLFLSAEGKTWLLSPADGEKYSKALELVKLGADWEPELKALLEAPQESELRDWCESQLEGDDSGLSISGDTVAIDGIPVYGALCRHIEQMHSEGFPLDPILNFVRKLRKNPSYRIREQLWGFIEACQQDGGFTLHSDGDIMAYKVVGNDWMDKHSHTFDNHPGCIVQMPRNEVDDDPNHTCSSGLHFCAYSYVGSFKFDEDRLVLVKISPEDVVSIPSDYGNAKARCCRYEVVEEIGGPVKRTVYSDSKPSGLKNGVYDVKGDLDGRCYVFKRPGCGLDFELNDIVKARLDSYDGDVHVGCLVKFDEEDSELPWCLRFVDFDEPAEDVVEWWIDHPDIIGYPSEDEARKFHSDISRVLSGERLKAEQKFAVGDSVILPDDANADGCGEIVGGYRNGEGKMMYTVRYSSSGREAGGIIAESLLRPVLKQQDDESGDGDIVSDEIEKLCRHFSKTINSCEGGVKALKTILESLADAERTCGGDDEDGDESDEMSPEFWVTSWIDASTRQRLAEMLEAKFPEMLNSRISARISLLSDSANTSAIKAEIEMWLRKKEGIHPDIVWNVAMERIKDWMRNHG